MRQAPYTTIFEENSPIVYTGIKIYAVHEDGTGTEHFISSLPNNFNLLEYVPDIGTKANLNMNRAVVKCAPNLTPYAFDFTGGTVNNGSWTIQNSNNYYSDIYGVKAGHKYLIYFGKLTGNVFKAMFTTSDIMTATSDISGDNILNRNSSPEINEYIDYEPSSNGYLIITKSTNGKTSIPTYIYDVNAESLEKTLNVSFPITVIEDKKPEAESYSINHWGVITGEGYDSWFDASYWWPETIWAEVTYKDALSGENKTDTFYIPLNMYGIPPASFGFYEHIVENPSDVYGCIVPSSYPVLQDNQLGFWIYQCGHMEDPHFMQYYESEGMWYFEEYGVIIAHIFIPFLNIKN